MTNQTQITPYNRLKEMLKTDNVQDQIKTALGARAGQFTASILTAVNADSKLRNCDPSTIVVSAMKAAALDLPIEPALGFAYLVPYKNQATFMVGWRGLVQMALRTGQYKHLNVTEVFQGEIIEENRITGEASIAGQRTGDDVIAYIGYLELVTGFRAFVVMTVEEIHDHARKHSKTYTYDSSPWKQFPKAMERKTVYRRLLSTYGVMTGSLAEVVGEERAESDNTPGDLVQGDEAGEYIIEGEFTEGEETAPETVPEPTQ